MVSVERSDDIWVEVSGSLHGTPHRMVGDTEKCMDEDIWRSGEELPLAYDVGFRHTARCQVPPFRG
jgi:hypothetical protein